VANANALQLEAAWRCVTRFGLFFGQIYSANARKLLFPSFWSKF